MPAYLVDLPFDIIEHAVSLRVFFTVNVVNNIVGKPLDVSNVISQCHGVTLKRTVRLHTFACARCNRSRPHLEKMCAEKKKAAGMG